MTRSPFELVAASHECMPHRRFACRFAFSEVIVQRYMIFVAEEMALTTTTVPGRKSCNGAEYNVTATILQGRGKVPWSSAKHFVICCV